MKLLLSVLFLCSCVNSFADHHCEKLIRLYSQNVIENKGNFDYSTMKAVKTEYTEYIINECEPVNEKNCRNKLNRVYRESLDWSIYIPSSQRRKINDSINEAIAICSKSNELIHEFQEQSDHTSVDSVQAQRNYSEN